MSGTNERDLRALAYLATRLRTETMGAGKWDDNGIWPILKKFEGQNLASVIERVTRHAQDPEAKTPGAMVRSFIPGPPPEESRHPFPARVGDPDECPEHKGQRVGYCGPCASEKAPDPTYGHEPAPTPARVPPAGDRDELITNIREQIKAAKAALQPPVTKAGRQEDD